MKIHPTLWIVIGIAVLTAHFQAILMLFLVIFVHEMGHACCATYYKWRIKSIMILPFGGMMETDEYGNRTLKEDLFVILFGPLQHLWLFLLAFSLHFVGLIQDDTFTTFSYVNGAVCLFNLLPIWPLDGGKILFLFLSFRYSFIKSHKLALQLSLTISVLLFLVMISLGWSSLNALIIFAFIVYSIVMDWRQRQYIFMRFLLERHYGKQMDFVQLKPITVDESERLHSILQKFQRGCKHPIVVTKNGKERGALDENEILHAYFSEKKTSIKIGELLYL